ncbi:MAG: hypothetical protein ACE5E6_02400 [Phycisphaerae bacterium]
MNTVAASRTGIARVAPDRRCRPIGHAGGVPGAIRSSARRLIRDLNFADFTMLHFADFTVLP